MYSDNWQHQHGHQQGALNRSDPQGYQTWGMNNVSTPNSETLHRKRNQLPPHSSRPPLPASADRRGPIYNSFTSTYHGLSYSDSKRDPPPTEGFDLSKTRRVIFSKQLEIHEKQKAQGCSTPTIPILRTGNRSNKNNAPTPRSDSTSKKRDPTPRSADRAFRSSEKRKTINDILEELSKSESSSSLAQAASSDPPTEPLKRSHRSPGLKSPRDIFSRIALRDRSPNQSANDNTRSAEKRHSMEPEALASQPLLQTKINNTEEGGVHNSWDISDLFPDKAQSSTPQRNQTRPSSSITQSLQPGTLVLDGSEPSKDHWDNPDLDADPWTQYLRDRSPSNSSTESQEAILIRKDSRNPRRGNTILRPAHAGNDDDSYNTNYTTHETPRATAPAFRIPRSTPGTTNGRRNNEYHEKSKYSHLDEDGEVGSYGTEVVLIQSAPRQNGMDDESTVAASPPVSNRQGFGSLLKRASCKKSSDRVGFEELPVRAMSFDESIELKKGTADTSDSDSGVERKQKDRRWNISDRDSASSHYDDDDSLLPYYGSKLRNKWRVVFMLVCLVICCLCVGLPLYYKLVSEENTTTTTSTTSQEMDVCVASVPGQQKYSNRYEEMRKVVVGATIGDANNVDEPGTAQRKALCWIADFDSSISDIGDASIPAIIQRYTMAVLYFSMVKEDIESDRSLKDTNYLSPSHECDWTVVMCGIPKKVTALLLSDKDLRGSIPPEIANLADLSFLELSLNYLSGTIPTTVETLSSLEYFAVAFNSFSGSIPSQLGSLARLAFINMRSSQVSGRIPTELGRLVNLETLLLEGNWLSGTIPQQLGSLFNAQHMSFRKNYLTGRVPNDICELRDVSLKELKVDSWVECDCCTE